MGKNPATPTTLDSGAYPVNSRTMSRAIDRTVFICDFQVPSTVLGGLVLTKGVASATFYAVVEIVLVIQSNYFIQNSDGDTVPRNAEPLLPGTYLVDIDTLVQVNNENVLA